MDKPRVLICGSLRERGAPCGITASVYNLVDSSLSRQVDFRVLSTFRTGDQRSLSRRLLHGLRLGLGTSARILLSRASIVEVHTASGTDFLKHTAVVLAAKLTGRRCVLRIHGGNFEGAYRGQGPLGQAFTRTVLRLPDRVVALSDGWLERLGKIAPKATVVVVPNSVQVDELAAAGERRKPDAVDVLLLANLCKDKGHFEMLHAFQAVHAKYPHARLLLAGAERDAGAHEELSALARQLGIADAVRFLGAVSGDAKLSAFADAGLFVLPSHIENMPVSIIEAMASGLPVIATRVGAIPEMIDEGVTGLLIPPRDGDALRDSLLTLLGDPALRLRLGARAAEKARECWDVERVAERSGDLYRALL